MTRVEHHVAVHACIFFFFFFCTKRSNTMNLTPVKSDSFGMKQKMTECELYRVKYETINIKFQASIKANTEYLHAPTTSSPRYLHAILNLAFRDLYTPYLKTILKGQFSASKYGETFSHIIWITYNTIILLHA